MQVLCSGDQRAMISTFCVILSVDARVAVIREQGSPCDLAGLLARLRLPSRKTGCSVLLYVFMSTILAGSCCRCEFRVGHAKDIDWIVAREVRDMSMKGLLKWAGIRTCTKLIVCC